MAKRKPTSSQVAQKAGVSQATVSMILNRRNDVSFSAETVERVECSRAGSSDMSCLTAKHKNQYQKRKTDRCDLSDTDQPILRSSVYRVSNP